jgi:hypothetical protein
VAGICDAWLLGCCDMLNIRAKQPCQSGVAEYLVSASLRVSLALEHFERTSQAPSAFFLLNPAQTSHRYTVGFRQKETCLVVSMALQKLARQLNPPASANIRFREPQTASQTHPFGRQTCISQPCGQTAGGVEFSCGPSPHLAPFWSYTPAVVAAQSADLLKGPMPCVLFRCMQSHRASDCRRARIVLLPSRSSPPHPAQTLRRSTGREAQHDGEKAGDKESHLELQVVGDLRLSPADLGWDRCPIESAEDTRVCAAAPPPEPLATFSQTK